MARTKATPPKLTSITLVPPPGCTASLYTSDALRGTTMGTVYVQIIMPATPQHRKDIAAWLHSVADSVSVAASYTLDSTDFEAKDLGVLIALKQAGSLTPEQVKRLDVKLADEERKRKSAEELEALTDTDEEDTEPEPVATAPVGPPSVAREILGT